MSTDNPVSQGSTYWEYLHLDKILNAQTGFNNDETLITSDELHFIVIHQTYELWFKLIIRELRLARDQMSMEVVPEEKISFVVQHLDRVVEIFKLAINQFQLMETLSPQDFLAFRSKLGTASGFQSVQMREIEILLGMEDNQRLAWGDTNAIEHIKRAVNMTSTGTEIWGRIEKVKKEITIKSALHSWLYRTPIYGTSPDNNHETDKENVNLFIREYILEIEKSYEDQIANLIRAGVDSTEIIEKRFQESINQVKLFLNSSDFQNQKNHWQIKRSRAGLLFIESYRDLPLLAWPRLLIDKIVEMEELMILWRTRHARMVERIIGRRVGTGGSSGVDYLDSTTKYRIFKDLWTVRTTLLPKSDLPKLQNPEFYQFSFQKDIP